MLLGRMRDLAMSACLVAAAQKRLALVNVSAYNVADPKDRAAMEKRWEEASSPFQFIPHACALTPKASSDAMLQAAAAAKSLAECVPFISSLLGMEDATALEREYPVRNQW